MRYTDENKNYILDVNNRIDDILSSCPSVFLPVMEHLKKSKGKSIRSALIVETACSLSTVTEEIINFAACIELLHLATLVHDDVIDDSGTRRGVESLQKKFGEKLAVISGDYLFSKCFNLFADRHAERIRDFSKTISLICTGEAMQHQFNRNLEITKNQYLKIIAGKTAALFAFAAYGTVMELKNNTAFTAERMLMAGYHMGMAFQMIDDCLDYYGKFEKTKKTVFIDLDDGVITYPLIYALSKNRGLKAYLTEKPTKSEKEYIISEVIKCGGIEKTKELAKHFYDSSMKNISKALTKPDSVSRVLDSVFYREA